MANITERKKKDGTITYRIKVHKGKDPVTGKQLKPYSTTWEPDPKWSPAKAQKVLNKFAVQYEDACKKGLISQCKDTFTEYAQYVFDIKLASGKKKKTIEEYKKKMSDEDVTKEIGWMKVQDIEPRHLNSLYTKMLNRDKQNNRSGKLSPSSVNGYHRVISSVLSFAVKEGLIQNNPAKNATPPQPETKEANYFQPETVDKILDCLESEPIKWRLFSHLLFSTGARRGEICGLEWHNIFWDRKIIKIEKSVLYTKEDGVYADSTKTRKARYEKLPDMLFDLLVEYRDWFDLQREVYSDSRVEENDFVFTQQDGRPIHPDSVTSYFNDFSKKYDLQHINPHAFRHTYSSILIAGNIDVVTVSKSLGHQKVSTTTNMYSHLIAQREAEVADCIANTLYKRS